MSDDFRFHGTEHPSEDEFCGYLNDSLTARWPDAHYRNPGPTLNMRGVEPNTGRDTGISAPMIDIPEGLPSSGLPAPNPPDGSGEVSPQVMSPGREWAPDGR